MVNKKLILLENEFQAKEYLQNLKKFKGFVPISFDFKTEQVLNKEKIKFKMEEEYEDSKIYQNVHEESINATLDICKSLKLNYRGVEIFPLFYYDIYTTIAAFKKNLRILKKIIKKECPERIVVFKSKDGKDIFSKIIKNIFDGQTDFEEYVYEKKKNVREKYIFKIASRMQKKLTKLRLFFSGNKNKIFVSGGKIYFKDLSKALMKNSNNKIFNFGGNFTRSFFVRGNYLPYYEFTGRDDLLQDKLKKDIIKLKEDWSKKSFSNLFGIEEELENAIKEKLFSIIGSSMPGISSKLEEFYLLLKNKKVNIILLSEESHPFSRGIVQLAKKFDVPTMTFQHGLFLSEVAAFSDADYVFSVGGKQKELYSRASPKETKIKVMGIPRYDSLKKMKKQRKEKIILYIMEISREEDMVPGTHLIKKQQKELLRFVFRVMKKFPEYRLIIKTRSNWEMDELPKIIAEEQNFQNFEIIEKTDNNQLLNDSDLAIVNFTSMGLEALMLGKPVISLSYKEMKKYNPYERMDIVPKVYSEEELYKFILLGLKSGDKERELKDVKINKNSSQEISKIINTILNKHKRR